MRAEVITLRDGSPAPATVAAGITGVVLAPGGDQRFAGVDKGLIPIGGRALIKRVLEQLLKQVKQIVIVAGRNSMLYSAYGYRVLPAGQENPNPLSAMATALAVVDTTHALFVPADAGRLPADLGARLWQAHSQRDGAPCVVLSADGALPECCLIARSERASIEQALAAGRSLTEWLASRKAVEVDFREWPPLFWGLSSPKDVATLEDALLR
ncbi:MAG TPA: NTP transferase domain-containing protein [Nevskiaceae bacterium]|nr:NTP transferase domain-containing protein [Nevskiaceae bacterium]